MTGMLNLVEAGPEKLNALTKGLEDSGGASALAAAQMKDNLKGSMEQLSGAVETLQIGLGSALAPAVRMVADGIAELVNFFNGMPGPMKEAITIGAAVVAGLFAMTAAAGALTVALGFLLSAETAVALPIVGVVAAIVGVGVVIAALAALIYANWDSIEVATVAAWKAVSNAVKTAWDAVVGFFKAAWAYIGPTVTAGWDTIKTIFTTAIATVKTIVSTAWEVIKTLFATAFLVIVALVTGKWVDIGKIFSAAGEKLKGIISTAWEKIKALWSNAFEAIGKSASDAWNGMKQIFSDAWDAIKSWFGSIVSDARDIGKNIIQGMVDGVASMVSSLASKVRDVVGGAINAAKNLLQIHSPSRVFMEIGGYTGEGLAIGLDRSATDVARAAEGLAAVPVGAYEGALSAPDTGGGRSSLSDYGAGQDIVINLDGREIGRSTTKYIGRNMRMLGAIT